MVSGLDFEEGDEFTLKEDRLLIGRLGQNQTNNLSRYTSLNFQENTIISWWVLMGCFSLCCCLVPSINQ